MGFWKRCVPRCRESVPRCRESVPRCREACAYLVAVNDVPRCREMGTRCETGVPRSEGQKRGDVPHNPQPNHHVQYSIFGPDWAKARFFQGRRADMAKNGRWTSSRKAELVLQVLRGQEAEAVAQEATVELGELQGWQDQFVEAGKAGLKAGSGTGNSRQLAKENAELRARLGDMLLERELGSKRRKAS